MKITREKKTSIVNIKQNKLPKLIKETNLANTQLKINLAKT